jgi:hypothetical protein
MVQELRVVRQAPLQVPRQAPWLCPDEGKCEAGISRDVDFGRSTIGQAQPSPLASCEHRTVAKDGRIVCARISEGDSEISPNICRFCPFRAVNCAHLRFSLRRSSPAPLLVRYNGRTEVWNDGPAELRFERAACTARVIPVQEPRSCTGCTLRQPIQAPLEQADQKRRAVGIGKVVPFPSHEPLAATG